jgi:hypothetical protein
MNFSRMRLSISSCWRMPPGYTIRGTRTSYLRTTPLAKMGAGASLDTTNLKQAIVAFIFGERGLMADLSLEGSRFKKQDLK